MRFLPFFSLFCFIYLLSLPVQAQGHRAFCGQAESTAASQGCLKLHLESAQRRLKAVYKKLGNELEGEKSIELQELQKTWLDYRDAECMWESERSETPSLKRINEISCMARVTEDRADLLVIASMDMDKDKDQQNGQREYGSFPRWMNVVAKDHPAVFWNYGKRSGFDLDCDGDNEYFMTGIKTTMLKNNAAEKSEKSEKKGSGKRDFSKKIIVAIAQNPPTGRPAATIFEFPVKDQEEDGALCHDDVSLSFEDGMQEEKEKEKEKEKVTGKDDEKVPSCQAVLKVSNKGCAAKIISWTGKDFELEIKEKPEEKPEEKK